MDGSVESVPSRCRGDGAERSVSMALTLFRTVNCKQLEVIRVNGGRRWGETFQEAPPPTARSRCSHSHPRRQDEPCAEHWEELSAVKKVAFYPDAFGEANSFAAPIQSQPRFYGKAVRSARFGFYTRSAFHLISSF